jgi:hypothetical protein
MEQEFSGGQNDPRSVLEYETPRKKQGVIVSRIVWALVWFFGTHVVLVLLAIPAVLIGGAGHGTACGAILVLPWGIALSNDVAILLGVTGYGLALAIGVLIDRRREVFKWLLIVHAGAVFVALVRSIG